MRGEMLWFNEDKDHGLILTEDGERLAVHGTGFAGSGPPVGRCAQAAVRFEVSEQSGMRRAQSVVFENDTSPRRARARRGMRGSA